MSHRKFEMQQQQEQMMEVPAAAQPRLSLQLLQQTAAPLPVQRVQKR